MSGTTVFTSITSKPLSRLEREDVDGATLAEDVERDLGRDLPSIASEPLHELVDQCRMSSIAQSVEPLALVLDPDSEIAAEGSDDTVSRAAVTRSPRPARSPPTTQRDTFASAANRT